MTLHKKIVSILTAATLCIMATTGFATESQAKDELDDLAIVTMAAEDKLEEAIEEAIEEARIAEEKRLEEERIKAEEEAKRLAALEGDRQMLAAIIFCEAGNQPYEGQVAVGAVVMNRIRDGRYPGTVYDVLHQSGQFGPVITGWYNSVYNNRSYTTTAYNAALDALNGVDPTGGCLSFGNGNFGLKIGDHYFH